MLVGEADAGRFGRVEVDAVLAVAGYAAQQLGSARAVHPAGLTDREVDVLRLIARGHANKQVAAKLGISPKTVGRHIEHIYAKAGVSTRAGATLFAMEQGLLSSDEARPWGERPIVRAHHGRTLPRGPATRKQDDREAEPVRRPVGRRYVDRRVGGGRRAAAW